jgi:hypothetical protein
MVAANCCRFGRLLLVAVVWLGYVRQTPWSARVPLDPPSEVVFDRSGLLYVGWLGGRLWADPLVCGRPPRPALVQRTREIDHEVSY